MRRPASLHRLALLPLLLLGPVHATSAAQVRQKGALVLGTDPQFAPFEFKNDAGEIVGFDVDIARAIAKDLGVPLKIESVGFDALMPASVTSGRVDLAMSGITITPERGKVVSFSNPYFRSAQVFITKNGNPGKFAWPVGNLKGKTVGVQANTTGQYAADDKLKPLGANIKIYQDFSAGLADVRAGRIDALIGDAPTVDYLKKALPGQYQQAGKVLVAEDYGAAFGKNSDLVAAANKTLARLRASGAYQKLLDKWIVQKK